MTVGYASLPLSGNDLARRNALFLALSQGVAGANATVVFATGSLVGQALAPSPGWATVPLSTFVLGSALCTFPASMAMRRFGRRTVFMGGNVTGAWAGLLGALGVYLGSFTLFCAATLLAGVYHAIVNTYRFAAADTATAEFRPKAISWVLTGGVAAAVIGPQLVIWTQNLATPYMFAATFLAQGALALAAMTLTSRFVDAPVASSTGGPARPLAQIARTPRFIVAVLCGTAAQALMNMVMTAAPLAMKLCGHSVTDSTLGIQWHVVAMFAPSFFTGALIARFGKEVMVAVGLAILAASAFVDLAGTSVPIFWAGLVLLGLGWNFAFIGATSIITDCHSASERNKVQGLNDLLIFTTTALGSFLSGHLLATFGWDAVNILVIPVAIACLAAVLLLRLRAPFVPA
jgi:predicted MFS family arabinose efflux permease